ncbi:MAG: hypothetical protein D6696_00575 [Acidobacteria bacterium]|nr:MAG: hypothetical protein D6696_00575 [Acidobacteriota bacterium]
MAEERSIRGTPRIALGLLLIVFGVLLALDRLGFDDVWSYWPVLLIALGIARLQGAGDARGRRAGAILLVVGGLFLLDDRRLGILGVGTWDLLPVLFLLFGAALVWRGIAGRREPQPEVDAAAVINGLAICGGASRSSASSNFKGGDLVAIMGGVEVDLTRARIAGGPAVIDVFALWGGVEIRVPRDWSVSLEGIPLLGGFEDHTVQPRSGEEAGQLIVRGLAIMGGVEVKNAGPS